MAKSSLREIAEVFIKIGLIGFGGPAAHIALIEEEVIEKRKWMSKEHFLDLIGATNLIPGPNSTEMVMHCGFHKAGWKGLFIAGLCFITPAMMITAVLAHLYLQYGHLPAVEPFIYGIKPAVISLIIGLLIKLTQKALKSWQLGVAGITAMLLSWYGIHEIYIFFGISFLGVLINNLMSKDKVASVFIPITFLQLATQVSDWLDWKLFLTFLKVGAILYGSGYVLFAFLDAELVDKGILTTQQLTDAIAAGQFTPGPVLTSATFIGWQLGGPSGAILATLGIFLPSFIFVGIINPMVHKLRKSKVMSTFLNYVNIIAVALIFMVSLKMTLSFIYDWRAIIIGLISVIVTLKYKRINGAFIIVGGAFLGYLLAFIQI
ncbi:chromate efflux transporter [Chondrinema litorale]|uniref:chromate efflux transporter n=1 Tax=Chondrinema litorale TaxID=2994555 RepID=UPI0025437C4B|nr:chromate efflux transporter [Chondrinema litorale]UZR96582.1 chromate efflux transporter [Chondrinema litorale]